MCKNCGTHVLNFKYVQKYGGLIKLLILQSEMCKKAILEHYLAVVNNVTLCFSIPEAHNRHYTPFRHCGRGIRFGGSLRDFECTYAYTYASQ